MEENPLALPSGYQIEHFQIESIFWKNETGITYIAIDLQSRKRMTITELLPESTATRNDELIVGPLTLAVQANWEMIREQFLGEARFFASFSHPAIVAARQVIEANGTVYMVADYVEGECYEAMLRRGGPEPDQHSLMAIISPILDGLGDLHEKGLLHCGINPEHILITPHGQPVLIDFSFVCADGSGVTASTVGYSAIEQCQTQGQLGPWTDIYALGVLMCRAITGDTPPIATDRLAGDSFQWLSYRKIPGYSEEFLQAVDWALRVPPEERPTGIRLWAQYLCSQPAEPSDIQQQETSPVVADTLPPAPEPLQKATLKAEPHSPKIVPKAYPKAHSMAPQLKNPRWGKSRSRKIWVAGAVGAICLALILLVVFASGLSPGKQFQGRVANFPHEKEFKEGMACLDGPKDETRGLDLISKAATAGNAHAQCKLGYMYLTGEVVEKNPAEGAKWVRKAVDQGLSDAQCLLAWMYLVGEGVEKNPAEADRWYRKAAKQSREAAEQGVADAQCRLGGMCERGEGIEKNPVEAIKWYRKAAEQGDVWAQSHLGSMYMRGNGVEKNPVEAVKWCRKAAEQGVANAQVNLSSMYEKGEGVEKDPVEAVKWLKKAAEFGNAVLQERLGRMYRDGDGVEKNPDEADKWFRKAAELYRKAAERGDARSQKRLGEMYRDGVGVEKSLDEADKWFRKVVELYHKAAERGDAWSQERLGEMYREGIGVEKSPDEANKWFRKAAEIYQKKAENDANSQFMLGQMYARGKGMETNPVEALKWYRKAAEQGDASLQLILGQIFINGEGVEKNPEEALKCYRKAAADGEESAKKWLKDNGY